MQRESPQQLGSVLLAVAFPAAAEALSGPEGSCVPVDLST